MTKEQEIQFVKNVVFDYLNKISALPLHPCDDARNAASVAYAKATAQNCIDLLNTLI